MQDKLKERLKELKTSYEQDTKYFKQLQDEINKQRDILVSERAIIQELEELLGKEPTDFNDPQNIDIEEDEE